jgi:hypothetical protein
MEREKLLKMIAPCGLACYTCTAAQEGVIQTHSEALLNLLESFDRFAEQFSTHEPRLKKYPDFVQVLQLFSEAGCTGCRSGACPYPGCRVQPCITEKGYDFCFECEAFPCDKLDADPALKDKWLSSNERMRAIGVEAYFDEVKDRSHYA